MGLVFGWQFEDDAGDPLVTLWFDGEAYRLRSPTDLGETIGTPEQIVSGIIDVRRWVARAIDRPFSAWPKVPDIAIDISHREGGRRMTFKGGPNGNDLRRDATWNDDGTITTKRIRAHGWIRFGTWLQMQDAYLELLTLNGYTVNLPPELRTT